VLASRPPAEQAHLPTARAWQIRLRASLSRVIPPASVPSEEQRFSSHSPSRLQGASFPGLRHQRQRIDGERQPMTTGSMAGAADGDGSNDWRMTFSNGDRTRGLVEAEVISAIEYDRSGELLATGNKGGRVAIFSRSGSRFGRLTQPPSRQPQHAVYTEFQSHKPEFDYLKSLEIEEKINQIKWCRPSNNAQYLLSTNDKTIKLWKVHERNVCEVTQYNAPQPLASAVPVATPYHQLALQSIRLPQSTVRDRVTTSTPKRVYAHAHTYHINSIALNSDGETFMSADDLRVNLWSLAISNQSFSTFEKGTPSMRMVEKLMGSVLL
jgi:WD40 repeat protein